MLLWLTKFLMAIIKTVLYINLLHVSFLLLIYKYLLYIFVNWLIKMRNKWQNVFFLCG